MIDAAIEQIRNAVNVSMKDEHGEDAYVHGSIVISLVELPRTPDGGPGEPRLQVDVTTTTALSMKPAMQMLEDAATVLRMREGS